MNSDNSTSNSYSPYYKKINKSEAVENKNFLTFFGIDKRTNSIVCEFNHKYPPNTRKVMGPVDVDNWTKFIEKVVKKKLASPPVKIDNEDIELIQGNLDQEFDKIVDIVLEIKNKNKNNSNTVVGDEQQEQEHEQEQKGTSTVNTAELLLNLFEEQEPQPVLFKDQFLVPHVLINLYGHYQILPIEDTKFRRYLSKLYYDNFHEVPNAEAARNVILLLAAKAVFEGDIITLHLRTAWLNNNNDDATKNKAIYYDLSDEKNRCIKITADVWTILDSQTEVLFRRYNHQIPQIEPLSVDDVDDQDDVLEQFITLLNIKNKNDRLLLKCYIVSLFIPDIPQVILILLGEQGGAKSTLQELVRSLVDPSILKNLTFPNNENEFVQQLSHNYIVYYDNVSSIQEWISNLLCRAVTGSSLSKRALYTNDEDIYYSFMRKLGINGIDLAKINSDLSDRSITIKPGRIDKLDRVKINKIWNQFNALKPRLLGYIFNILSKVLKYKETHGAFCWTI